MSHNEMIGAILGAITALAGFFFFFYDKLSKRTKEEHEYRTKQLEATLETNYEIRRLNEMLSTITINAEKQRDRINKHDWEITEIKTDVTKLTDTVAELKDTHYKKHYVE